MNKYIRTLAFITTSLFISSCSVELEEYKPVAKPFDIKSYFDGKVIAWGIVQDYTNEVKRRFCVEIEGSWQENQGILAEKFYFDDGEISYRNWQLTKLSDGSYVGGAEDVVGEAIGKHQGFAFQFQYTLSLNLDGDIMEVAMDDWMYQLDENKVFNKTAMSKFGVQVAEITLFFDKETTNQSCQSN
ncbi:hypothetical protein A3Q34_00690 [Colwellia sp. PAMC 20917]|uniref:DUF3833 domain-containing protein n=1 Tax=Colwellia sp. PAMC 20917 TaxID=1816218 RepID=UPI0008788DFC|nr:DUF3833 domain-containing protein [Colwellia sp. PAMC 20917]AOW75525.1 hypothetical protein A3Q34_00690 [Colwellia sp. PAMC 20917]